MSDTTVATALPSAANTSAGREQAAQRRRALGEFIRSRRERTTPEMVGMPGGLRRRTPGLRREEVALLSGIGITWYTWLEQGRPINVSAQVLLSVVRVLGFDDNERAHVFALADLPDPEQRSAQPRVGSAVAATLDQLAPYPAMVIGPRWTILAANRAYVGLLGDFEALPLEYRNTIWLHFADLEWRRMIVDWPAVSARVVAKLRSTMAEQIGDPEWDRLLALLMRSPEFRDLWARQEVAGMEGMTKQYDHPEAGPLTFTVNHMWLTEQHNTRMTVYVPMDDETRERLPRLMTVTPRVLPQPPEDDGVISRAVRTGRAELCAWAGAPPDPGGSA